MRPMLCLEAMLLRCRSIESMPSAPASQNRPRQRRTPALLALRRPVQLLARERRARPCSGRPPTCALGGVFLRTAVPLAEGQRVRVALTIERKGLPVIAEGIVMRAVRAQHGLRHGVGVEFLNILDGREGLTELPESLRRSVGAALRRDALRKPAYHGRSVGRRIDGPETRRLDPGLERQFQELWGQAAPLMPLPPGDSPQLYPGLELWGGRFQIVRRIGAGGMGVVYEAYDRERGENVALKTLSRMDAASIYRLKNEFRALADVIAPEPGAAARAVRRRRAVVLHDGAGRRRAASTAWVRPRRRARRSGACARRCRSSSTACARCTRRQAAPRPQADQRAGHAATAAW